MSEPLEPLRIWMACEHGRATAQCCVECYLAIKKVTAVSEPHDTALLSLACRISDHEHCTPEYGCDCSCHQAKEEEK